MAIRIPSLLTLVTTTIYLACIALVTIGLFRARDSMVERYGTDFAQTNWQQWRDAAGERGPVARDEPKSDLPPAFVLMQDHFNACLAFSLLMTSSLFATLAFLIRGAFFYEQPAANRIEKNEFTSTCRTDV